MAPVDVPAAPVTPPAPAKRGRPKKAKVAGPAKMDRRELTLAQKQGMLEYFPELFLGRKPYPWVKDALRALWPKGSRVALRAANGSGKTSEVAVAAILWHMVMFPGSQTVVTAGVYRQITEVLWPVLRSRVNGMGEIRDHWEITENRIRYTAPTLPGHPPYEPALCNGFSAEKPEAAEGWHARGESANLLYVIDEAKAVPNGIFDAMERCQPTRLLVMSSPGGAAGAFYDIFRKGDDRYERFQVTAYDCPHIEKKWIDEQIAAYGIKSPVIQSMIFAEFCDEDGSSLVLPPSVLQKALSSPPAKVPGRLRAGCDFAAGGDENVIQIVDGNRVKETIKWVEKDTMAAVGRFITEFKRHGLEASQIWADNGGIGIPMCDALSEAGWSVNRVNNGEAAFDKDKFANRGTEMAVQFARMVELNKIILPPEDLVLHRQLTTRRLEHNSKGKLIVEPKEKMLKRGLGSPDRADALVLAVCGGGMSVEDYQQKMGGRVTFGDIEEYLPNEAMAGAWAGS